MDKFAHLALRWCPLTKLSFLLNWASVFDQTAVSSEGMRGRPDVFSGEREDGKETPHVTPDSHRVKFCIMNKTWQECNVLIKQSSIEPVAKLRNKNKKLRLHKIPHYILSPESEFLHAIWQNNSFIKQTSCLDRLCMSDELSHCEQIFKTPCSAVN